MAFLFHQILENMRSRKATFLANEDWATAPFQVNGYSPLQRLFGRFAAIPGTLEKMDDLNSQDITDAKMRLDELMSTVVDLENLAFTSVLQPTAPLYWSVQVHGSCEHEHDVTHCPLWFHDLSVANVFTHLWAFQIICFLNIATLWKMSPGLRKPEWFTLSSTSNVLDYCHARCTELSIRILRSVRFLTQESHMLFGPYSTVFPLQTACGVLGQDNGGRAILQGLSKEFMDILDRERLRALVPCLH